MSKFREEYFEDHVAQPYTTTDGKVKVEYVYRGSWIQWGVEGSANRRKLLYGLLEAASIIKTYITEFDYKTIDRQITIGGLIRVVLVLIAVICGVVSTIRSASMDLPAVLIAAGLLASAVLSAAIFQLQRKIGYRSYKNINGKVGPEN